MVGSLSDVKVMLIDESNNFQCRVEMKNSHGYEYNSLYKT